MKGVKREEIHIKPLLKERGGRQFLIQSTPCSSEAEGHCDFEGVRGGKEWKRIKTEGKRDSNQVCERNCKLVKL